MESGKIELPEKIGKYEKLSLIGEGGCAKVFKAFDPELERWVALKLLAKRFYSDKAVREQFFREIKIQAGLSIPGIVRVFDSGDSPHGLYYTMELVNGENLEQHCRTNALPLKNKLFFIAETARIVAEIHKQGMIHRDIKARNVMIDEYGQVKLLDLGLASLLKDEIKLINDFHISGSPAYMPPEAFENENTVRYTTAADIYSFSVMSYEIICGCLPYEVEFLSLHELAEVIKNEPPKAMSALYKEKIPVTVQQLVLRGLSANPAERPSAAEFVRVMRKCSLQNSGGRTVKITALVAGTVIAAVIIYHLLLPPAAEKNTELTASYPEPEPELKTVPQTENPVLQPTEAVKPASQIFYRNSSPEELKPTWKSLKHELATESSFREKGALYYSLPEKSIITFKRDGTVIRSIDSRFEKSGNIFHKSGGKICAELRKNSWDKPFVFEWHPVSGNVDFLCLENVKFETENGGSK